MPLDEIADPNREQFRQQMIDAVENDHERLATDVIEAIADSIGEYGFETSADLWEDVRAHCDANIRQFLVHARSGRRPTDTDLDFVREATKRRVRQGVPVDAVLHSFRIGHRMVWDALVEPVENTEIGGLVAIDLARTAMAYIDAVSTCVADTYLTEQQLALADADRAARDLLELILAGDPAAAETAEALGTPLEPSTRYSTVVASIARPTGTTSLARLVNRLRRAFPLESLLVAVRQQTAVCVIACETVSEENVARRCHDALAAIDSGEGEGRASIGLARPGPTGIAESYRQAVSAQALCAPGRPVVSMANISLLEYLAATADESAAALIPDSVRQLALSASESDRGMVETLEAFVRAQLNVRRTATELPAHPNTVRYRLSRVAERANIQWRDPVQVVELLISIRTARRMVDG